MKYAYKTLTMPIGTVFELDYTNANRRRVNRFEYLSYTIKTFKMM